MPTDPLVACVCLAKGRREMVQRAIRSYCSQTYKRRMLLLWVTDDGGGAYSVPDSISITTVVNRDSGLSIGMLRNRAAEWLWNHPTSRPDLIAHWDSDDWSHPRRLEEQVESITESRADAVGYNSMIFYRETDQPGAWVYLRNNPNYAIGTSLLYWTEAWRDRPFADLPKPGVSGGLAEDSAWLYGVRVHSKSSLTYEFEEHPEVQILVEPRMIASVHGSNTSADYYTACLAQAPEFQRAPEWDEYCAKAMAL